jgi:hypothetical protein
MIRVAGGSAAGRTGAGAEDLVTALIVHDRGRRWGVSFIGDNPLPKDTILAGLNEDALRWLDVRIASTHKRRPVDVSFAWYPWESKHGSAQREFMIFEAHHEPGRYLVALDGRPEVTASSPTFEGLAEAIEAAMAGQPAADLPTFQACITWDRTLTPAGYTQAARP